MHAPARASPLVHSVTSSELTMCTTKFMLHFQNLHFSPKRKKIHAVKYTEYSNTKKKIKNKGRNSSSVTYGDLFSTGANFFFFKSPVLYTICLSFRTVKGYRNCNFIRTLNFLGEVNVRVIAKRSTVRIFRPGKLKIKN